MGAVGRQEPSRLVDSVEHHHWGTMGALKGTAIESIDFEGP